MIHSHHGFPRQIFRHSKATAKQLAPVAATGGLRAASDLSLLLCGKPSSTAGSSEVDVVLKHVSDSIDTILNELVWLNSQDPARIALFGPFLGRSLQELAALALIGRLDPLRVLLIQQVQAQPSYKVNLAWKSSLRWQGDVLAEKVSDLWGEKVKYDTITKALLGDYFDHLVWRSALGRVLSHTPTHSGKAWLTQLRREPREAFVDNRRKELSNQYSSLSKGIHHEFVMPPGAQYDKSTVSTLIGGTVHTVATLGLVSHFVSHSIRLIPATDAFQLFDNVEDLEVLP